LFNFFDDELQSLSVAVIIPDKAEQAQLRAVLDDPQRRYAVHQTAYSAVAYPFATSYQNSDGWLLETYVMATHPEAGVTRETVQQYLRTHGYQPSALDVGWFKRTAASLFTVNVAISDHTEDVQTLARVQTHTGDSLIRYLGANSPTQENCEHGSWGDGVCVVNAPGDTQSGNTP
jgi:hypothetical protein